MKLLYIAFGPVVAAPIVHAYSDHPQFWIWPDKNFGPPEKGLFKDLNENGVTCIDVDIATNYQSMMLSPDIDPLFFCEILVHTANTDTWSCADMSGDMGQYLTATLGHNWSDELNSIPDLTALQKSKSIPNVHPVAVVRCQKAIGRS